MNTVRIPAGYRGISLAEAVCTLFLFAVVLSVVGSLLTDSTRLLRKADELSWANRAADWLTRIERNTMSAYSVAPSPGTSDSELVLNVRDLDSPNFLPEVPLPSWSVDDAALQVRVRYRIVDSTLQETTTPNASTPVTVEFGLADTFTVERKANGNLSLTLINGQESLRREIAPFTINSQAAPL